MLIKKTISVEELRSNIIENIIKMRTRKNISVEKYEEQKLTIAENIKNTSLYFKNANISVWSPINIEFVRHMANLSKNGINEKFLLEYLNDVKEYSNKTPVVSLTNLFYLNSSLKDKMKKSPLTSYSRIYDDYEEDECLVEINRKISAATNNLVNDFVDNIPKVFYASVLYFKCKWETQCKPKNVPFFYDIKNKKKVFGMKFLDLSHRGNSIFINRTGKRITMFNYLNDKRYVYVLSALFDESKSLENQSYEDISFDEILKMKKEKSNSSCAFPEMIKDSTKVKLDYVHKDFKGKPINHISKLIVTSTGIVGAAVSAAVTRSMMASMPIVFDRTFKFFVIDTKYNIPLFEGFH